MLSSLFLPPQQNEQRVPRSAAVVQHAAIPVFALEAAH